MSPRGSSSAASAAATPRNSAAPYSRRPAGQPKSSRQQFSACGACRMRRVRCDLKDLPMGATTTHPACSNCQERGLKCVDEFADVKAVKLLRRGRRLQQVEAIYGKAIHSETNALSSAPTSGVRTTTTIPRLMPDFFASPFWRWFSTQHPILDANEFPARFSAHTKHSHTLGHEGGLIAMLLVVWAISFGFNEHGMPEGDESETKEDSATAPSSGMSSRRPGNEAAMPDVNNDNLLAGNARRARKETTDLMVREVLELIDSYGILRRPTWDGVRVLLLLIPLIDEIHPLERLAIHEAALSQTQALCTLAASTSGPSSASNGFSTSDDAIIRARIFWYAHIREGISTGMKGGRLVLNNDDLDMFQRTLPPFGFGTGHGGLPSPTSPSFPQYPSHGRSSTLHFNDLFSIPLHLGTVCRRVHAVLTGPKATRNAEETGLVNAHAIYDIWEELDHCWESFDALRRAQSLPEGSSDIDQFVAAWLIFIFECHNVIREALKQCIANSPGHHSVPGYPPSPSSRPSSQSSHPPAEVPPHRLHEMATQRCFRLLPSVLRIIQLHLPNAKEANSGLFQWDSGLVRDGCFFAGILAASFDGDVLQEDNYKREGTNNGSTFPTDEGVALCIAALGEMKWAFSKSEERQEAVRMAWKNRKGSRRGDESLRTHSVAPNYRYNATHDSSPVYGARSTPFYYNSSSTHGNLVENRPLLPPPTVTHSPRRPGTGHSTGYSSEEVWTSYTPPGTGTSVATSATGASGRDSPVYQNLPCSGPFKTDPEQNLYHTGEMDPFVFTTPVAGALGDHPTIPENITYNQRTPSDHGHMFQTPTPPYITNAYASTSSSTVNDDIHGCPQFTGDQSFYHPCHKLSPC